MFFRCVFCLLANVISHEPATQHKQHWPYIRVEQQHRYDAIHHPFFANVCSCLHGRLQWSGCGNVAC